MGHREGDTKFINGYKYGSGYVDDADSTTAAIAGDIQRSPRILRVLKSRKDTGSLYKPGEIVFIKDEADLLSMFDEKPNIKNFAAAAKLKNPVTATRMIVADENGAVGPIIEGEPPIEFNPRLQGRVRLPPLKKRKKK